MQTIQNTLVTQLRGHWYHSSHTNKRLLCTTQVTIEMLIGITLITQTRVIKLIV